MKKSIVLIVSIFIVCSCHAQRGSVCDESKGNALIKEEKYNEALVILKECEYSENVTGLTLGQLATLYGYFGKGEFKTKRERFEKVFDLYIRSAKKGDEDSIQSLVTMYENGEPMIELPPQSVKADCLEKLLNKTEKYSQELVEECLYENSN